MRLIRPELATDAPIKKVMYNASADADLLSV